MFAEVLFAEEVFAPGASITNPTATATARAIVPRLVSGCRMIIEPLIYGSATAVGNVATINEPSVTGVTAAATAEGHLALVLTLAHAIVTAKYLDVPMQTNRVYIVGIDDMGNPLYGEDTLAATTYGEKLKVLAEPMISDKATAESVAGNILANVRLFDQRGMITIPPNCGMELWDVIEVDDEVCNQSTENYRVAGYKLEYVAKQGKFLHHIILAGV